MSTLNPNSWLRKLCPTARRLLVEKSLKSVDASRYNNILVIGAGHDPYRKIFGDVNSYTRLDIVVFNGVTDVVGDAGALPFDEKVFDCVLAIEVLEHVKNPIGLVNEAHRVLRESGALVLTVPFAYHQHGDPFDYWRPTRSLLETATSAFSESKIEEQGNRIHVISDLVTTAHYPWSILFPLRIFNRVLTSRYMTGIGKRPSTAPSGFFVITEK